MRQTGDSMPLRNQTIGVCALGNGVELPVKVVAAHVSGYLKLTPKILSPLAHPAYAFSENRLQYDAGTVLRDLENRRFIQLQESDRGSECRSFHSDLHPRLWRSPTEWKNRACFHVQIVGKKRRLFTAGRRRSLSGRPRWLCMNWGISLTWNIVTTPDALCTSPAISRSWTTPLLTTAGIAPPIFGTPSAGLDSTLQY